MGTSGRARGIRKCDGKGNQNANHVAEEASSYLVLHTFLFRRWGKRNTHAIDALCHSVMPPMLFDKRLENRNEFYVTRGDPTGDRCR